MCCMSFSSLLFHVFLFSLWSTLELPLFFSHANDVRIGGRKLSPSPRETVEQPELDTRQVKFYGSLLA